MKARFSEPARSGSPVFSGGALLTGQNRDNHNTVNVSKTVPGVGKSLTTTGLLLFEQ